MYHHIREFPESGVSQLPPITATDRCIPWPGRLDRNGYGIVMARRDGRKCATGAHRLSYLLHCGEIPQGLVIDHLCRNRACINPLHLEAVTNRENIRRGETGQHTHRPLAKTCKRGHEYTPENTRYRPGGARLCRACRRAFAVKYYRAGRPASA